MNENMSGILVIDKERGYTSFDVVARLRGILKIKKIGHTGTLDPDATGVLVCCIGKGTKLISEMESDTKTYRAGMKLGLVTDTQDIWGEVLSEAAVSVNEDEIKEAILGMQGDMLQTPPMYSAKKIDGKKLYEYAREGKTVERKPVSIRVHSITDVSVKDDEAEFTAMVSKGTYIRTLINDIGEKLGYGACMSSLRRITAGKYDIGQAHTLDEVEEMMKAGRIGDILLPLDTVFDGLPKVHIKEEATRLLINGNPLTANDITEGLKSGDDKLLIYMPDGTFAALYEAEEDKLKVRRMFL